MCFDNIHRDSINERKKNQCQSGKSFIFCLLFDLKHLMVLQFEYLPFVSVVPSVLGTEIAQLKCERYFRARNLCQLWSI